MKIQLSDHFTTGRLLRFALPSIVMMLFTSIYGVVDGIWIALPVAETLAIVVTAQFLIRKRHVYHYA